MGFDRYHTGYEDIMEEYPILSFDEEMNLFMLLKENSSSRIRQKLIYSNMRLVVKQALRYYEICGKVLSLQDLVEYGICGLIRAVDKFDYIKGCKFSTYAVIWIKNEIINGLNEKNVDFPVSYNFYKQKQLYYDKKYEFFSKYERMPSIKELSLITGFSCKRIRVIEKNLHVPISLDSSIYVDSDISVIECAIDDSLSIEEISENNDLRRIILYILDSLNIDDYKKEMFILRYGLDNNGERTLKYLAKKYGVSHQAISQSIQKILLGIESKYSELFSDYIDSKKYKR